MSVKTAIVIDRPPLTSYIGVNDHLRDLELCKFLHKEANSSRDCDVNGLSFNLDKKELVATLNESIGLINLEVGILVPVGKQRLAVECHLLAPSSR